MVKRKKRLPGPDELARLIERDLTELARGGRLLAAHGVEPQVAEVVALLTRGGRAPLLAGEAGVGKSAIVHAVARAIAASGGQLLDGAPLVEVSIAGVFARASTPKQAAELFERLLEQLATQQGTIVYARDAGLLHASSLVPPLIAALQAGKLRFLLEADGKAAQELLRGDEALAERLHLVPVAEPTPERARWILGKIADELQEELRIPVEPAACDMALRLSSKFLPARRLPRKAIELLRETAAEASNSGRPRCDADDLLARFCSVTRLPRFLVDDQIPLDLAGTERHFSERLLGQSDAVEAVLRSVALLKAGLNDPRRPLGVFLFAGPTGVGKTHLAKLLTEYVFGAADRMIRLNMADYPEEGDELAIFGSPWAQNPEGKRGELARLLDGKVFTVLLLDEFEKAHADCHDRFLQLFDEGRFVTAAGQVVVCSNTVIVATSNVGSEVYRDPPLGFSGTRTSEELITEVDRRIAERFRPEFLNRFDAICHFHPLGRVEIRKIAQREVGRVLEREGIRARGLDVDVTPEVVDLLVEHGFSPLHGARFLQREIEKTLTAALAVEIARRPLPSGTRVRVEARAGGRVVAVAEERRRVEEATHIELPAGGASTSRRRLDRKGLSAEADALLARAAALALATGKAELLARREELLAHSQAPTFWDEPATAAEVLREFRELEGRLGELERLDRQCTFARRRAGEAKDEALLAAAGRAVEAAARELLLCEARLAGGSAPGGDEVELELAAGAEGDEARGWVLELADMYLRWAGKRGFSAQPVAEGAAPALVVLRLTGPGVLGFLTGEEGLHRKLDERLRLATLVRVHRPSRELPDHLVLAGRDVKRRAGFLLPKLAAAATARDDTTGRELTLLGAEREGLGELAGRVLLGQARAGEEARRYHFGRGARVEDSRTGAATPRLKDVLRGELDLFLAAFVGRPPPAPAE